VNPNYRDVKATKVFCGQRFTSGDLRAGKFDNGSLARQDAQGGVNGDLPKPHSSGRAHLRSVAFRWTLRE
jgi:hypothetical protein